MRRSLVAISDKGVDLIKTLSSYSEEAYALISQKFGRANYETLAGLLRKLESELGLEGKKAYGKVPLASPRPARNVKAASSRQ
jgi:hypothetical protein